MNNDNRFSYGFLLGLIIGGGAVFLLGTKTGKNILKIISEEGLEGITKILEEYDLNPVEVDEFEDEEEVEVEPKVQQSKTNGHARTSFEKEEVEVKETPSKRRFFKRGRK